MSINAKDHRSKRTIDGQKARIRRSTLRSIRAREQVAL